MIKKALSAVATADFDEANSVLSELWGNGYCGLDIVGTLFRLTKVAEINEEMVS